MKLKTISIRVYDVGWGDCFLLRFEYLRGARHVLIDFGTTASSFAEERERLMPVAADIRERCGGKLDAVVATHRHRDHIGGFAALQRTRAPGNVIAELKPDLVLQPWTEDPRGLQGEAKALAGLERFLATLPLALTASGGEFRPQERSRLLAMAQQNYTNRQAIESLARLGRKRLYLSAGSRSGLERLLPGFSVRVLGPARPAAGSWEALRNDRMREVWRQLTWAGGRGTQRGAGRPPLFPDAPHWHPAMAPPRMRWFISQLNRLRAEEVLRLAYAAHREINNTSLVLLIEGFGHRLLFPGDVELDGWARALHSPSIRREIEQVTLYKASHHAAGNGTPRSVWSLIGRRSEELRTIVSRPRTVFPGGERLLAEMSAGSELTDTASLRASGRLFADIELEPRTPAASLAA